MIRLETNFDQLIEDLRKTGQDIEKGVKRGMHDAGRTGKGMAARESIEAAGSKGKRDSRGAIGAQVRKGTRYKASDNNVTITMNDRLNRSLSWYATGTKSPKADYRGKGVQVEHWGSPESIFTKRAAFIREANGGRFMAAREGNRKIGKTYFAHPHSRIMVSDDVAEPIVDAMQGRFFSAVDRAFKRG